ncbi:MAG TPA: hypothetical protein VJ440_10885 [Candidatus Brocadiaceae bacterium]|nr:hypothetical protein [Candidatus Brocadiaceae bacterium]
MSFVEGVPTSQRRKKRTNVVAWAGFVRPFLVALFIPLLERNSNEIQTYV